MSRATQKPRTRSLPDLQCPQGDYDGPYSIRQILNSIENNILEMKAENKRFEAQLKDADVMFYNYRNLRAKLYDVETEVGKLAEKFQNLEDFVFEREEEEEEEEENPDFEENVNNRLKTLEKLINHLEIEIRANNLVMVGLVEVKGENLIETVKRIGNEVQYPLSPSEINACLRKTTKQVLVKFVSKETRDQFMNKVNHFSTHNSNFKIYAREELPLEVEILFSKALEYKETPKNRRLRYKFVWLEKGNIYMQKTDRSQRILIRSEEDLPRNNKFRNNQINTGRRKWKNYN